MGRAARAPRIREENVERGRVVVTGMGILAPTGNTVSEAWANIAAGNTGIDYIQRFDTSNLENHFGGEVKHFDPEQVLGKREARRTDRVTQMAVAAAAQAWEDSGLHVTNDNRYDIAVIVGSGIGGISTIHEGIEAFERKGARFVSPLLVPMMLPDSPCAKISMLYGLRGPNFAISTACATGNDSIGQATEMIRRGQIKAALAGSSEAGLVSVAMAAFNNMTAISRRNDNPKMASRPFDRDRDGFVVGEGAAVLVLEDLQHALERGAKIYAEILGFGQTSDAYHVTAPLETGEGAAKAMQFALRDARLQASDIDYINAHGTSTPLNDAAETLALKQALGETAYEIPISSTKSMTGHLMGAAGSVEAVFSIMAIREDFIPPTINLDNPDPACDLNYTPNVGVKRDVKIAMSNAFGFGGHNSVIILGEYNDNGRA
jgi:beta-ketoacyl-acyl-carrier-protein synthase II